MWHLLGILAHIYFNHRSTWSYTWSLITHLATSILIWSHLLTLYRFECEAICWPCIHSNVKPFVNLVYIRMWSNLLTLHTFECEAICWPYIHSNVNPFVDLEYIRVVPMITLDTTVGGNIYDVKLDGFVINQR